MRARARRGLGKPLWVIRGVGNGLGNGSGFHTILLNSLWIGSIQDQPKLTYNSVTNIFIEVSIFNS